MSITAVVSHFMSGFLDTVRRSAIAYSICALCGIAILILGTCAAVMALVPVVGAVYAQLIVAAVFLMVIVVTMIWLQRPARQAGAACGALQCQRRDPAAAGADRAARDDHRGADAGLFDVEAAALAQEKCTREN